MKRGKKSTTKGRSVVGSFSPREMVRQAGKTCVPFLEGRGNECLKKKVGGESLKNFIPSNPPFLNWALERSSEAGRDNTALEKKKEGKRGEKRN